MPAPSSLPLATASAPASPRRRLSLAALGLAGVLGVFGWGIVHLFALRFAGGDVYPPYSTLRKDPLGAAAFHDALADLPGLTVERNLRPLASLGQASKILLGPPAAPNPDAPDPAGPPACFYLGADASEWPFLFRLAECERLDAIMRQGGRVILTFRSSQTPLTGKRLEKQRRDQSGEEQDPASDPPFRPNAGPTPPADATPKPATPPGTGGHSPARKSARLRLAEGTRLEDLVEGWGIDFRRVDDPAGQAHRTPPAAGPAPAAPGKNDPRDMARPATVGRSDGAEEVSWHSVLDFDLESSAAKAAGWQAWWQRGHRPVIVARPVGDRGGELILASDSYFLSNEALRAEARPALLASLVGPARRVIFDETHLGIAEQPGMMTLARRYGLQGGLAALGLLAALFIWRNVVSLVPPPVPLADPGAAATSVTGRDAAAGFLNLLRRGVPPRELIGVCLEQWRQAPGPRTPDAAAVERLRALAVVEAAQPARSRSPATAYRAMCAALRRPEDPGFKNQDPRKNQGPSLKGKEGAAVSAGSKLEP